MMNPQEKTKQIEIAYSAVDRANDLLTKIALKTAQLDRDVKKLKNVLSERLAEQEDQQQK
ncbi:hypothetical protein [Larkinella humicola]|uniref:Uncharacterized protein n=1 Tax=Larkinella humicola TaxID=2607654 RepID=A0A5N1JBY1_9BACT|nr:hypothetical protein [Larkinella humicola]KAA9349274.1 hypothetical protein F0P93_23045 [Larkinella humicola]